MPTPATRASSRPSSAVARSSAAWPPPTSRDLLDTAATIRGAEGSGDAATASLYARLRGPTGLLLLPRPLRYVLEASNSNYVGDQRGVLGFNFLSSVGTGFEIDTSAVHTVIGRVRYVF